ncbi:MAG: alpha/beta hydrolase [Sutterella sp.]|nr:alpha/beta hydrolase [Sutterella sp.]
MQNTLSALCLMAVAAGAWAADGNEKLMGYTEGAEVIDVARETGRIDEIVDIVYSQIKGRRHMTTLKMTVLQPKTDGLKPAVVYFPGGGFTSADYDKFIEMRMALARAGFVVAAAQYRTVPVKFPALIEDAKTAVRYLKAHADMFGIDPSRVAVLGDSAGGYVTQMLAAVNGEKGWDKGDWLNVDSNIAAAVSLYGISDLMSIGEGVGNDRVHASPAVTEALLVHGYAFRNFEGASILSDKKKALAASALGHVDGTEPPVLLMHGTADKLVSPLQSKRMYEALKAKGTDVSYILLKGAGHADDPWFQPQAIARVVNWLKLKLGGEKARESK